MQRDVGVELFRIVCMLGVCLIHSLCQGGYVPQSCGLAGLFTSSVVGFIFISGYFGVRLHIRHVKSLLVTGLSCAIIAAILYHGLYLGELRIFTILDRIRAYFQYAWFLWMYLALMCMAPAFDPLFENVADVRALVRRVLPFIVMVFIWSYASVKVPIVKRYTPSVCGFGDFSVLTFMGVYLVARSCRVLNVESRAKTWWLFLIAVVSGLGCWIGICHYNSPFALLFAGSSFFIFKRMKTNDWPLWVVKAVLCLAPSMFAVYLFHSNSAGFAVIRDAEDYLIGGGRLSYYPACFLVTAAVFAGGVVLDLPRRLVVTSFRMIGTKKGSKR